MKWIIDKTFEFCYGHRVWTQTLNGKYADDLKCACRHRHGHEGKVQVFLTGERLDDTGMITDFRHLEWLKKFINAYIDHRFIADKNDPAFDMMIGKNKKLLPVYVPGTEYIIGYRIDTSELDSKSFEYELDEGVLAVDFVPTSENLSKWMADFVDFKMKDLNVAVEKVDWWETPKSRSTYIRPQALFKDGKRMKRIGKVIDGSGHVSLKWNFEKIWEKIPGLVRGSLNILTEIPYEYPENPDFEIEGATEAENPNQSIRLLQCKISVKGNMVDGFIVKPELNMLRYTTEILSKVHFRKDLGVINGDEERILY